MIRIFATIFAGLLGLAFGSFLNVCVSRWPMGESVVTPGSHCRHCEHTLSWWENVPLVSWLVLRGRCWGCGAQIAWRYPLVELAVGALWAAAVWESDAALPGAIALRAPYYLWIVWMGIAGRMILYWLLVGMAILDAENLWLPDFLTLPGIVLGGVFEFVHLLLVKHAAEANGLNYGWSISEFRGVSGMLASWIVQIILAALLIVVINGVYWLLRRREGIGMGDAKLMALLAAWLGLPGALLAFGLGVVLGALLALGLLALPAARRAPDAWALRKLPLGTFLCVGGILSSLWGKPMIEAYLRWSGLS